MVPEPTERKSQNTPVGLELATAPSSIPSKAIFLQGTPMALGVTSSLTKTFIEFPLWYMHEFQTLLLLEASTKLTLTREIGDPNRKKPCPSGKLDSFASWRVKGAPDSGCLVFSIVHYTKSSSIHHAYSSLTNTSTTNDQPKYCWLF